MKAILVNEQAEVYSFSISTSDCIVEGRYSKNKKKWWKLMKRQETISKIGLRLIGRSSPENSDISWDVFIKTGTIEIRTLFCFFNLNIFQNYSSMDL